MKNSSVKKNVRQRALVFDFKENYADEIMQIQSETRLSFWSEGDYLEEIAREDSVFKIAQNAEGKIIGYALVRLLKDNSNSFDLAEILNIAVLPAYQKQGIGQMIFDEILRLLAEKNVKEIWLEVRESNLQAIAFYRKNGFEKQFERKDYYCNPKENALILMRRVSFLPSSPQSRSDYESDSAKV